MTSTVRQFAQSDNRVETITLTGNITNNGSQYGVPGLITQRPAYAAIDLRRAKNFYIDTRPIQIRTDTTPTSRLLYIYISSDKPASYHPNFEFDIIIDPPTGSRQVAIKVFANRADAESNDSNRAIYELSNEVPSSPGDYSIGTGIITFKVFNNSIVLKGVSGGISAPVF